MLKPRDRFAPNRPSTTGTVVDGEVIIRRSDGTFYRLSGVGALVWEMIQDSFALRDVTEHLAECYSVDSSRAERDVYRIVGQLIEEKLLIPKDGPLPPRDRPEKRAGLQPYEEPALRVYRDMADLLTLDPVAPGMPRVDWKTP